MVSFTKLEKEACRKGGRQDAELRKFCCCKNTCGVDESVVHEKRRVEIDLRFSERGSEKLLHGHNGNGGGSPAKVSTTGS